MKDWKYYEKEICYYMEDNVIRNDNFMSEKIKNRIGFYFIWIVKKDLRIRFGMKFRFVFLRCGNKE